MIAKYNIKYFFIGLMFFISLGCATHNDYLDKINNQPLAIYLTFDDGPSIETINCAMLCKSLDVKATFFLIGKKLAEKKNDDIFNYLYKQYPFFMIGNHSYSHANEQYKIFYEYPNLVVNDILKADTVLKIKNKIVRLPGRNSWYLSEKKSKSDELALLCSSLYVKKYKVIGWDVEWEFDKKADTIIENHFSIINKINEKIGNENSFSKNNLVILIHERSLKSKKHLQELEYFITYFKRNKKVKFLTLREY